MPSPWFQPELDISRSEIPRPEYPRPSLQRGRSEGFDWINLNGDWDFEFDEDNQGEAEKWYEDSISFGSSIQVPFAWESHLAWHEGHLASNENWFSAYAFIDPETVTHDNYKTQPRHEIGWYRRSFLIPSNWETKRTILHFGASDWETKVWVNGHYIDTHEGGYASFSFDITEACTPGEEAVVIVRVYDPNDHLAQPAGKQIGWYARTSGIWQTVYLEPRPATSISRVHITPEIDQQTACFDIDITDSPNTQIQIHITVTSPDGQILSHSAPYDNSRIEVTIPNPLLWEPETPHLYDTTVEIQDETGAIDRVSTYFGMRKVHIDVLPGTSVKYIFLNNHPIYLLGALNQSFNPWGIYTFPSDEAIQDDLRKAKAFGFNFLRIHIKVEDPRFLYWADRLGVLLMCDIPNFGNDGYGPTAHTRWEQTLRDTITRDYNHPSIFSWCCFNESWGLGNDSYKDMPDRQDWVRSMFHLTRSLDASRIIEDNSPCFYDHVETQINSWHFYINDYGQARDHIKEVVDNTFTGSNFNYAGGNTQNDEPLMNSEYGGISAGGGDKDISWCFKYLTNELRLHEKICGYVYTELQDIEWEHNGFMNYDRTVKAFGYDYEIINALDVVLIDAPPGQVLPGGSQVDIDIKTSHFSKRILTDCSLHWRLDSIDHWAQDHGYICHASIPIEVPQYRVSPSQSISLTLPEGNQICALHVWIEDKYNAVVARNFINIEVHDGPLPPIDLQADSLTLRYDVAEYTQSTWSDGTIEEGDIIIGLGNGVFEYTVEIPDGMDLEDTYIIEIWGELASGRKEAPQTEPEGIATDIFISLNDVMLGMVSLSDAPSDSRGALSYIHGIPGRYGELLYAFATDENMAEIIDSIENNKLTIRLEVDPNSADSNGIALFGARSGRYPLQPCVVFRYA